MSLLTFPTLVNIRAFVQRSRFCKVGWAFLLADTPYWGHRWTLLFRRTSPGWCGELAGKRLFSGLRQSPTCKVSYTSKNWCVLLFAGKRMCGKEDESAQFASYFCSTCGGKVWPKFLEHSFVREFAVVVSLSFSDLWVCFGGGFQTKKMVLRLLI